MKHNDKCGLRWLFPEKAEILETSKKMVYDMLVLPTHCQQLFDVKLAAMSVMKSTRNLITLT